MAHCEHNDTGACCAMEGLAEPYDDMYLMLFWSALYA